MLGSPNFVGRADELRELHGLLQAGDRVEIAAATGMGGIGKTELAWQYCQAHRADYAGGIWWLSVRGGSIASQVLGLALRMGLGQPPDSLTVEAERVQWCFDRWGQGVEGDRLLVLDDVVAYGPLRELLPQVGGDRGQFRVLLTTRRRLGPPVQRLDLGVLKWAAAFRLLRQLVGDDARIRAEVAEVKALCEWVGRLPLGIELVGRYLARKPGLAVATLLQRLEGKRLAALAVQKVPEEMPYELNLVAAFELSWAELDGDGQRLGCLLSLFALAPIPWALLQDCLPEWDEEALEDCRDEQLLGQNLLEFVEAGRYQLHQVIRENFAAKLEERGDAEALRTAFAQVLARVAAQVPQIATLAVQEQMREVVPHLEEVASEHVAQLDDDDCDWPFIALASLATAQSIWQTAEAYWQQCLVMTESRFGKEHSSTATSLNNLALLYRSMGRDGEAEPLYARSLKISEEQLGPDHPDTATSLNNLAELYRSMGRYGEAEPLYARSLRIREEQLGPDHPDTAISYGNLAGIYESTKRFEKAEPLRKKALQIHLAQLGDKHPYVAIGSHNLAQLYVMTNRLTEAESLYHQAIKIDYTALGQEHPSTVSSFNGLANLIITAVKAGKTNELSDHPTTQNILQQIQQQRDSRPSLGQRLRRWLGKP